MTELKPCPFCNSTAHFDHDDDGWHWIECGNCRARSDADQHGEQDVRKLLAAAWNRRAEPEQAEPVAWRWKKPIVDPSGRLVSYSDWIIDARPGFLPNWPHEPLYAAPQQEQK